ncbi:hypothetical protein [Kocuria himachalensis]
MENRTDGVIERDDLELIPRAKATDVQELIASGLMEKTDNGWLLTEYRKYQTSAAKLEATLESRRENDRKRQAKSRAKHKQSLEVDHETGEVNSTLERVSRDSRVTDGGEVRERRGEALDKEVTSWPVADIPRTPRNTVRNDSPLTGLPPILCHTFGCSEVADPSSKLCPRHDAYELGAA